MWEKLSVHQVLKDLAQSVCDKYKDRSHQIPKLEKRLAESEENLKTTLNKVECLRKKETSLCQEKSQLEKGLESIRLEMVEKLEAANWEKHQALLDLKAKYMTEVKAQTQKAFNLGYTSTLEKYKIAVSDVGDDDGEEGEDEEDRGIGNVNEPIPNLSTTTSKAYDSTDASKKIILDVVIQVMTSKMLEKY